MRPKQIRALALAAALVGGSLLVPRMPPRWHPLPHAVLGTALAVITRAPLGLRPPALWSGLRLGLAVATPVTLGVAAATALPPVRVAMAERELPDAAARWLLLRIPLGTVWAEEAAFRAALGTVATEAFGPTGGRLLQSPAFGLSHIADARTTGEPVIGTVLVTGAAGWLSPGCVSGPAAWPRRCSRTWRSTRPARSRRWRCSVVRRADPVREQT